MKENEIKKEIKKLMASVKIRRGYKHYWKYLKEGEQWKT